MKNNLLDKLKQIKLKKTRRFELFKYCKTKTIAKLCYSLVFVFAMLVMFGKNTTFAHSVSDHASHIDANDYNTYSEYIETNEFLGVHTKYCGNCGIIWLQENDEGTASCQGYKGHEEGDVANYYTIVNDSSSAITKPIDFYSPVHQTGSRVSRLVGIKIRYDGVIPANTKRTYIHMAVGQSGVRFFRYAILGYYDVNLSTGATKTSLLAIQSYDEPKDSNGRWGWYRIFGTSSTWTAKIGTATNKWTKCGTSGTTVTFNGSDVMANSRYLVSQIDKADLLHNTGTNKSSYYMISRTEASSLTVTATGNKEYLRMYGGLVKFPVNYASTPTASNKVYNGASQTGVTSGNGYTLTGTSSATNVGNYTAVATLNSGFIWSDGTDAPKRLNWSITAKPLTITAKAQTINYGDPITTGVGQITYTTANLVSGQTITDITLTPSISNAGTGVITPSNAVILSGSTNVTNNYNITYNTGTLTINKLTCGKPTVTATTFAYDGSAHAIKYTAGTNGTIKFSTSSSSSGPWSAYDTTIPVRTNVGITYVKAKTFATDTTNYNDSAETTPVALQITAIQVPIPTAKTGLIYDGTTQTGVEKASEFYTLTGNTGKNATTYTATAILIDTNHVWQDNTNANKTISWSIAKATLYVEGNTYEINAGESRPSPLGYRYYNNVNNETPVFSGAPMVSTTKNTTKSNEYHDAYDILQGTLALATGQAVNNNYTINYTAGTLYERLNCHPSDPIHTHVLLDTTAPTIGNFTVNNGGTNNNLTLTATNISDGTNGSGIVRLVWEVNCLDVGQVITRESIYLNAASINTASVTIQVPTTTNYIAKVTAYDGVGNNRFKQVEEYSKIHITVKPVNQTIYKGQDLDNSNSMIQVIQNSLRAGDRISSVSFVLEGTRIIVSSMMISNSSDEIIYAYPLPEPEPEVIYPFDITGESFVYEVTYEEGVATILDRNISTNGNISISGTYNFIYDDVDYTPSFDVTWTATNPATNEVLTEILTEGIDFTSEYQDNHDAGTAKIIVTAMPSSNYTGSTQTTFTINKRDIQIIAPNLTLPTGSNIPTLDGSLLTHAISTIPGSNRILGEIPGYTGFMATTATQPLNLSGSPYPITQGTIALSDNDSTRFKANNYNMIFVNGNITVTSLLIANANIHPREFVYNGTNQRPEVEVWDMNGNLLIENYDYTVACTNNKNVGTANITITGINNVSGTWEDTFKIIPADITIYISDTTRYYGEPNPVFDYIISGLIDREDPNYNELIIESTANQLSGVGEYPITGRINTSDGYFSTNGSFLKGNYNKPTFVDGILTITRIPIDSGDPMPEDDPETPPDYNWGTYIYPRTFVYDGTPKEPNLIVVHDVNGNLLTRNVDFEVAFYDNINITTNTYKTRAVITGIGNYEGKATRYYRIVPRSMVGDMEIIFSPVDEITGGLLNGSKAIANVTMIDPVNPSTTSYQWYRSDQNGETLDTLTNDKKIAGATSKEYVVPLEDYDKYLYCIFSASETNYEDFKIFEVGRAGGQGDNDEPPVPVTEREAPTITVTAKTSDNNTYPSAKWTNKDVIFTINAQDNNFIESIKMSTDGSTYTDLVTNSNSTIKTLSATHTRTVETDSLTYYFKAVDDAGNESDVVTWEVRIDKTNPVTNASDITIEPSTWTFQNVLVTAKATDSSDTPGCLGSGINAYFFGNKNNPTNAEYTEVAASNVLIQATEYTQNVNNHYFVVKDQAGNMAYAKFNVKNIDKGLNEFTVVKNNSLSNKHKFVYDITAYDSESGIKEIRVNNIPLTTSVVNGRTVAVYETTVPGDYSYVCEDNAGNTREIAIPIYGIIYLGNGASGTMLSALKDAGASIGVDECEFTREDSEFVSWNTKEDGTGTRYNPGSTFSNDSILTLYATWEKIDYVLDRVVLSEYEYMYTGNPIVPQEKVYNTRGEIVVKDQDYEVSYEDNIQIGTAKVIITGLGKYINQKLETYFAIKGVVDWTAKLEEGVHIYNGRAHKPRVIAMSGSTVLQVGKDFIVEYENNIEAGQATATIRGIGQYVGIKKEGFEILKATRKLSAYDVGVRVREDKELYYEYTGEPTQSTLQVANTSYATVTRNSSTDRFVITGVSAGITSLIYRVAESKNYLGAELEVGVTVEKSNDGVVIDDSWDLKPINGKIIINDGDEYTDSPRTLLTIRASFADYMYLSEDGEKPTANAEGWQDYTTKLPYEFSDTEGEKIIFAWFKDKFGNMSVKEAYDTIILKKDLTDEIPESTNDPCIGEFSGYPAHDSIILDKTEIDKTKPDAEITSYSNAGLNVSTTFRQLDVIVNGVRSGVNYSTAEYGIKQLGAADYTWQQSNEFNSLQYGQVYAFVTRAKDRAGNGYTISEENMVTMPLKQGTIITLKDKEVQVDGLTHEIDPAKFDLAEGRQITGEVTYTYYIDRNCTTKTTSTRDGSITQGGAPSKAGTYYVICTLKDDPNYFDTQSEVAQLRIGWYIHKDGSNPIFAYVEETGLNTGKYDLIVTGKGEMKDLEDIKKQHKNESYTYWKDYLNDIVTLNILDDNENKIENIGADVFSNLTKIQQIIIPSTVKNIGDNAFTGDSSVNTKVTIPSLVTHIGINPFVDTKVTEFEVLYGNTGYCVKDGILYSLNEENLVAYPGGNTRTEYVIPDNVKHILPSAVRGADNLTTIKIPNGVTNIGERAFYDCNNLNQIEIFDLFDKQDATTDLISIGTDAFGLTKTGASIYTFDKKIADLIEKDRNYDPNITTVYWPPRITVHPVDANGAPGTSTSFYVVAEDGYEEGINYQWFALRNETGTIELISGATEARYNTPTDLTMANNQDKYFCGVWNMPYYYTFFTAIANKTLSEGSTESYKNSKLFSDEATLTMLNDAYYRVERSSDNTQYVFRTLNNAFTFCKTGDVIRVIKNVPDEQNATLDSNKKVELILDYNINMTGVISVERADLTIKGSKTIRKTVGNIINNYGTLTLDGTFALENTNGVAINSHDNSTLNFTAGVISATQAGIVANNCQVNMTSANAKINVNSTTEASGINITGYTKLNISAGEINVSSSSSTGKTAGILNDARDDTNTGKGRITITGGAIKANTTGGVGILNNNSADVVISNAEIVGRYAGIENTSENSDGNIEIRSGTVNGGTYGVLNGAVKSKVIVGVADGNVERNRPLITGDTIAIFNARINDVFEFYDGTLRSKTNNIVYEEININNSSYVTDPNKTDRIYTAPGRKAIVTETGYIIELEDNVSGYNIAYLEGGVLPELEPIEDITLNVGEKGTIETKIKKDGHPKIYYYEWEISIDNGATWHKATNGTGIETNIYTTPAAQLTMDGNLFRCKVSSTAGSVYTNSVRLYVIEDEAYRDQRPVVRINYKNGRQVQYTSNDASNLPILSSTKYVNMEIVIKSLEELKDVNFSYAGTSANVLASNLSEDGKFVLRYVDRKVVQRTDAYKEYTYTYNLTVYENGIITVKATDVGDRVGSGTQTLDIFNDIKVSHTNSTLTSTNTNLTVTFFANKQVRPIITKVDGNNVTLQSLDGTTYAYKWLFKPTASIPEGTTFRFEDEYGNMADDTFTETILRVTYKDIKFTNDDSNYEINDMTILEAYNVAEELDTQTELSESQNIQSKYGVNKVQADMFMARPRDVGAVDTLSNASSAKSYDGRYVNEIEAKQSENSEYGFVNGDRNSYVSAVAADETSLSKEEHVDVIKKDASLYKGADISGFNYNNTAEPYMYEDRAGKATNINDKVYDATFRAVIVSN